MSGRLIGRDGKDKGAEPESMRYVLGGHIWIDGAEGAFLGMGRMLLLERIRELGSITRAARSINMSYRRAWELVDSMNRQARSPLVIASSGGKGGGGATLTEAGEKAFALFKRVDADFKRFKERQSKKLSEF